MLVKTNHPLHRCMAMLCSCGIFLLGALSGQARAFLVETTDGGLPIRWPTANAGFYINAAGGPVGSLAALQAALATWSNVSASNFSFTYKGTTSSTNDGDNDGRNIICFGDLGAGYGSTLALNTFWFNTQTGVLNDSDIRLNTAFDWAADRSPYALDVQTLALHELGHALSLKDLYGGSDTAKVMYGYCSEGILKRSLTPDDMSGIAYLYPGAGTTTTTTIKAGTTTTTIDPGAPCPAQYVLGPGHPQLDKLRAFRDGVLSRSAVGRRIMHIYYDHADSITTVLERSPALRAAARRFFEAAALLAAGRH